MSGTSRGSQKARDALGFLRERISSSEWPMGTLIPKEPELMELIGVGRSTVREAVRALATFGMLETVPGVGTFVRSRTPVSSILTEFLADHDIEEVLVYRRSLEIEAAQHAAVRRTEQQLQQLRQVHLGQVGGSEQASSGDTAPERWERHSQPDSFHMLIVEASGSRLLKDLYDGVLDTIDRAIADGKVFLGASRETIHSDHGAVLKAIEDRDVRGAAHSMALHVDRDLGLRSEALEFTPRTERATSLIDAGYDPVAGA